MCQCGILNEILGAVSEGVEGVEGDGVHSVVVVDERSPETSESEGGGVGHCGDRRRETGCVSSMIVEGSEAIIQRKNSERMSCRTNGEDM